MRRVLTGLFLTALALGGGMGAGASVVRAAWASGRDAYAGFDTLARVLNTVETRYIAEVPTETLLLAATRGLVSGLDPWSVFLSPHEWASLQAHADGLQTGIGLELSQDSDGTVRVSGISPGGPADQAGIRVGARLLSLDGQAVAGQDLELLRGQLAGARGSLITLEVDQGAGEQAKALVREPFVERVVSGEWLDEDVLLVRIRHFSRSTRDELDRTLVDLQAGGRSPKGLILDLRGNPGGLMDQAAAVADRFLPAGDIAESRGRDGAVIDRLQSKDDADDLGWPLVVLLDEGSASAAEVVAGALQDRGRARLVGRRSYGKGTVQHVFELEDGSALKLTLARYHLPSGRGIADRQGLEPDRTVPLDSADAAAALRAEIRAAHLDPKQERALLERVAAALPAPSSPSPALPSPALPDNGPADPILEAAWKELAQGG